MSLIRLRRSRSVKKNTWVSIHTALKMSLLSSAFFLCSLCSITSIAVTHAVSSKCPPHLQPCAPTPAPAPTSAPTSIPPQPPKVTPPPQAQSHPITVVLPVSTRTAGTPPPAPPTSVPASSTAIVGIVTPNQTTTTRTDITSTNQQ